MSQPGSESRETNPDRLADRVALVTGGASGIGRAIAERIVREGGRVAVGDIDQAGLDALAETLGDRGVVLRCDATDENGPAALAALALDRFGRLDVAVANAGGGIGGQIVDLTLAQWRQVIELNLTSAFLTVQAAGRVMEDGGSIIAIASLSAVQPGRAVGPYCAAKAGVVALVEVAALELGVRRIRVERRGAGHGAHAGHGTHVADPGHGGGLCGEHRAGPARRTGGHRRCRGVPGVRRCDLHHGHTLLVDGGARHLSYPDGMRIMSAPDRHAEHARPPADRPR